MTSLAEHERLAREQRRRPEAVHASGLDLNVIVHAAGLAASSHNTQPWRFHLESDALAIAPDFDRRCPAVDPHDAHLFKSLGCAAENAVVAGAVQGFEGAVSVDAASGIVRVRFAPGVGDIDLALVEAIYARQCSRTDYEPRPIAADVRASFADCACDDVEVWLLDDEAGRARVGELVAEGDRVQIGDPAFKAELIAWMRFNPAQAIAKGDGLSMATVGKPASPSLLGPLIINLALTPESQARSDLARTAQSPLLALITTRAEERGAWVAAGRVYERLALTATAHNIRHAFINQPIEVRALRPELLAAFGAPADRAPSLLLRLGYGPTAAFSLRRPLAEVIA